MITAKIENGELIVHIPITWPPKKSKSGKTVILASTHGNQKVEIEGCPFWLGLNCYTYSDLIQSFRSKPQKELSAEQKEEIEKHNKKVSEKFKKENKNE